MSDDSKRKYLSYKASPFSALALTLMSLFMQAAAWLIYEKSGCDRGMILLIPAVLCAMYHCVQLDAGKNGNFSRLFCFVFSVLVPFAAGVLLAVIMYIGAPDISTFSAEAEYTGTPKEIISVYAGRFAVTSGVMLIFAAVDIPFLKKMERKNEKN